MTAAMWTVLLSSLALVALGAHRAGWLPVWPVEALLTAASASVFFAILGPLGIAVGLVVAAALVVPMRRFEAAAARRDERRLCRLSSF